MNRQEGIGFLGKDVKITAIADDRYVLQLRVGITSKISRRGSSQEHTEWFDVKAYCSSKAATIHQERGLKGAMVYFSGSTYTEEYKDQDHVMRYRRMVVCESARDIEYLKEPRSSRSSAPAQSRYEPRGGLPPRNDDDLPPTYGDMPFDDDEAPAPAAAPAPRMQSRAPAQSPARAPAAADQTVRNHRELLDFD